MEAEGLQGLSVASLALGLGCVHARTGGMGMCDGLADVWVEFLGAKTESTAAATASASAPAFAGLAAAAAE